MLHVQITAVAEVEYEDILLARANICMHVCIHLYAHVHSGQ